MSSSLVGNLLWKPIDLAAAGGEKGSWGVDLLGSHGPHPWMKLVRLWKVLYTSHNSTFLPESGTDYGGVIIHIRIWMYSTT